MQHIDSPLYEETVSLFEVILYNRKNLLSKSCKISLFGDRITIKYNDNELEFSFTETSAVTVLGRNKLNIYFKDKIYQIKPAARFNALKYVHMYHRHKNILKGDKNEQFLGL